MKEEQIKVLIVDDSKVARELLKYIIESDQDLIVIESVDSGEKALDWLKTNTCDVITMDIHMPVLNGFVVTEKIMESSPIPTVIISSGYTSADKQIAFKALEAGALAILEKPVGIGDAAFKAKSKNIVDTIKLISGIKLVTRRGKKGVSRYEGKPPSLITIPREKEINSVAIGASLGGPIAIAEILSQLPASFPVPIFVVQHIAAGFTEGFVEWLQDRCELKILYSKDKEKAQPGCVYIAPDKCQMEIEKGGIIHLDYSSTGLQPSVARLFKSMSFAYGPNCIGVILTGMGSDGAKELLLMSQKGAYTIAQDKESCVMFSMPQEAISLGGVKQILPLNKIAGALIQLVSKT